MNSHSSPPTSSLSSGKRLVSSDNTSLSSLSNSGWTNEKMRVGSPPLVELPLKTLPFDTSHPRLPLFQHLRPMIEEILLRRHVRLEEFLFALRCDYGRSAGYETVVIYAEAEGNYANDWALAVDDIRILLINRLTAAYPDNNEVVYVEVVDRRLEQTWWASPVETEHLLVRNWKNISEQLVSRVIGELPQNVKGDIQSINLFRYGPFPYSDPRNPPTIVVSIASGHPWSDWRRAEEEISARLIEYSVQDGCCLFIPGRIIRLGAPPSVPPNFKEWTKARNEQLEVADHFNQGGKYRMGDSHGSDKPMVSKEGIPLLGGFGTIGGFVRIRDARTRKEHGVFAVTNYHTVRHGIPGFQVSKVGENPPDEIYCNQDTPLCKADREGIPRSSTKKSLGRSLGLESPARRKGALTLTVVEKEQERVLMRRTVGLSQRDDNAMEFWRKCESNLKDYYQGNHNVLGSVCAASGFKRRSKTNGRLDWALLRIDQKDRIPSKNKPIKDRVLWSKGASNCLPFSSSMANGLQTIGDAQIYMVDNAPELVKLGACSGATVGQFNTVKTDVSLEGWDLDGGVSRELCFISTEDEDEGEVDKTKRFAEPSDSGAWVFDSGSRWLGMVVAGMKLDSSKVGGQVLFYVTPAADLVADMVVFFKEGGDEVEIELI